VRDLGKRILGLSQRRHQEKLVPMKKASKTQEVVRRMRTQWKNQKTKLGQNQKAQKPLEAINPKVALIKMRKA
jgi:hypothetical protein